jgi:molybdate transport system ATP-binding protein
MMHDAGNGLHFACRLKQGDFVLDAAFVGASGITALFGPSGSGKSTIIRLLAGLDRPQAGRIALAGRVLADAAVGIHVPPHRRRVGLVFQDAQLFPHLSVAGNLAYGQRFTPRARRRLTEDAVIGVLGIGGLLGRAPATLSGGERQRVAIGRALLASPDLLLMDEPLASLDGARKREILPFIERVRDELGMTIVYVSHSVEEVTRLAGHIVRLEGGRVTAAGPPADFFTLAAAMSPDDRVGAISILSGTLARQDAVNAVSVISHPAGEIVLPGHDAGAWPAGRPLRVAVRASDVSIALERPVGLSIRTALAGTVSAITTDEGPLALVRLTLKGGETLAASISRLAVAELALVPGLPVLALVKAAALERG